MTLRALMPQIVAISTVDPVQRLQQFPPRR
jgi:hypothetical protein